MQAKIICNFAAIMLLNFLNTAYAENSHHHDLPKNDLITSFWDQFELNNSREVLTVQAKGKIINILNSNQFPRSFNSLSNTNNMTFKSSQGFLNTGVMVELRMNQSVVPVLYDQGQNNNSH